MDKSYELSYISTSIDSFQGTESQLKERLLRTGEHVISGEDGCWIISTTPERKIYELVNGERTRSATPDKFLHEHGFQRITRFSCKKLVEELNAGKVDFSELL